MRDRTRENDFIRQCLKEEKSSSFKYAVIRLRKCIVRNIFIDSENIYLIHLLMFWFLSREGAIHKGLTSAVIC